MEAVSIWKGERRTENKQESQLTVCYGGWIHVVESQIQTGNGGRVVTVLDARPCFRIYICHVPLCCVWYVYVCE